MGIRILVQLTSKFFYLSASYKILQEISKKKSFDSSENHLYIYIYNNSLDSKRTILPKLGSDLHLQAIFNQISMIRAA